MKKIIITFIILTCFDLNIEAREKVQIDDLASLQQELINNNPELKSLLEQIKTAEANISLSTAWEDPMFAIGTDDVPISGPTTNRDTMLMFELSQRVPFPGKLKVKKEIAVLQKSQQNEIFLEKYNQLIGKFYLAYYDYGYLSEARSLYQSTISQLGSLKGVLENRYATGEVSQQDILKTKVEISKIQEGLIELQSMQQMAKVKMLALLNRDSGSDLKFKKVQKLSKLSNTLQYYLEKIKTEKPWLRRSDLVVQEAQSAKNLAQKELLPNFDFMMGYRFMENSPMGTEDYLQAKIGINIPIFTAVKQKKRIAEAESKINVAKYERQAMERELAAEIETIWIEINSAEKRIHILQERLIPEINASLESAQRNYETGEVEYISVITDRVDLFKMQLELIKLRYEREKKIVELKSAAGEFAVNL